VIQIKIKQKKARSVEKQKLASKKRYLANRDKILERQRARQKYHQMIVKEQKQMPPEELLDMVGYD
jgi:predicted dithiol-disulfide oxidoreductase (DUF899 family)